MTPPYLTVDPKPSMIKLGVVYSVYHRLSTARSAINHDYPLYSYIFHIYSIFLLVIILYNYPFSTAGSTIFESFTPPISNEPAGPDRREEERRRQERQRQARGVDDPKWPKLWLKQLLTSDWNQLLILVISVVINQFLTSYCTLLASCCTFLTSY